MAKKVTLGHVGSFQQNVVDAFNDLRGALVGSNVHRDAYEAPVAAANGTDLATSITLLKALMVTYIVHIADTVAHKAADATHTLAGAPDAVVDLATAEAAANDLKAKYNLHIASATVHDNADAANGIATADASDLATLEALVNATKTKLNAHMAAALGGEGLRIVPM